MRPLQPPMRPPASRHTPPCALGVMLGPRAPADDWEAFLSDQLARGDKDGNGTWDEGEFLNFYSKCLATPSIRRKYSKKVRVRLSQTPSGELAAEAAADDASLVAGHAAMEAASKPPAAPSAPHGAKGGGAQPSGIDGRAASDPLPGDGAANKGLGPIASGIMQEAAVRISSRHSRSAFTDPMRRRRRRCAAVRTPTGSSMEAAAPTPLQPQQRQAVCRCPPLRPPPDKFRPRSYRRWPGRVGGASSGFGSWSDAHLRRGARRGVAAFVARRGEWLSSLAGGARREPRTAHLFTLRSRVARTSTYSRYAARMRVSAACRLGSPRVGGGVQG